MTALRETFTSEYMDRIKKISLQLKTDAVSVGGRRKSKAKGQSVEFSDFRNYTQGDSVKNIDWKSYGRLDKLIIKLFHEERQANVNIILDTSGSMGFGDKGLTQKLLCACLCYMFMLNMDRVNIFAPGNTPLCDITSPSRINIVVDHLDGLEFSGEGDLLGPLKKMPLRQGSCIFISDFFTNDDKTALFKLLAYKRQKLSALVLLDKTEADPELDEDVTLEDCENGRTMPAIPDKTAIKKYKAALDAHLAEIANAAKKAQGQFAFVRTDMNVLKVIKDMTVNF